MLINLTLLFLCYLSIIIVWKNKMFNMIKTYSFMKRNNYILIWEFISAIFTLDFVSYKIDYCILSTSRFSKSRNSRYEVKNIPCIKKSYYCLRVVEFLLIITIYIPQILLEFVGLWYFVILNNICFFLK